MSGAVKTEHEYQRWLGFRNMPEELLDDLYSAPDIEDRFRCPLEFGTGGLRGVIGAGLNRMNIYTVAQATRGLCAYILAQGGPKSCAVAYDSRKNSLLFAQTCAQILADKGIRVYMFPEPLPTPMLSYAVRRLGCSAGVVITASHNPANYNGYKVYGPDGGQVTDAAAAAIYKAMQAYELLTNPDGDFEGSRKDGTISYVGRDIMEAYYNDVLSLCVNRPRVPIKVAYSALHGTGFVPVSEMMKMLGNIELFSVPEQQEPDASFHTCKSPNPEDPCAMALAIDKMLEHGCDLCIATDPDGDRAGVGIPDGSGGTRLLTGNEAGVLQLEYLCIARKQADALHKSPILLKTIVTTPMADEIAACHGIQVENLLTGFKYIGERITALAAAGEAERFLFAFEESCGYLSGDFVRDKDAVIASMLICEMASWYKQQGKTLIEALDGLYLKYGYYKSELLSHDFKGSEGIAITGRMLNGLRSKRNDFMGRPIERYIDYLNDETGLPKSNVVGLRLQDGGHVVARPSGTEPKLKLYLTVHADTREKSQAAMDSLLELCRAWLADI